MRLQQETQFLQQVDFYGTVIDIEDDTVIVEFGNNKNCRYGVAYYLYSRRWHWT